MLKKFLQFILLSSLINFNVHGSNSISDKLPNNLNNCSDDYKIDLSKKVKTNASFNIELDVNNKDVNKNDIIGNHHYKIDLSGKVNNNAPSNLDCTLENNDINNNCKYKIDLSDKKHHKKCSDVNNNSNAINLIANTTINDINLLKNAIRKTISVQTNVLNLHQKKVNQEKKMIQDILRDNSGYINSNGEKIRRASYKKALENIISSCSDTCFQCDSNYSDEKLLGKKTLSNTTIPAQMAVKRKKTKILDNKYLSSVKVKELHKLRQNEQKNSIPIQGIKKCRVKHKNISNKINKNNVTNISTKSKQKLLNNERNTDKLEIKVLNNASFKQKELNNIVTHGTIPINVNEKQKPQYRLLIPELLGKYNINAMNLKENEHNIANNNAINNNILQINHGMANPVIPLRNNAIQALQYNNNRSEYFYGKHNANNYNLENINHKNLYLAFNNCDNKALNTFETPTKEHLATQIYIDNNKSFYEKRRAILANNNYDNTNNIKLIDQFISTEKDNNLLIAPVMMDSPIIHFSPVHDEKQNETLIIHNNTIRNDTINVLNKQETSATHNDIQNNSANIIYKVTPNKTSNNQIEFDLKIPSNINVLHKTNTTNYKTNERYNNQYCVQYTSSIRKNLNDTFFKMNNENSNNNEMA
ncbi:MAG: hypothetical protein IJ848_00840 [Alphaproteobacteria bacterium]|nr:hypothetical protein [Alphaproteobacteria bacterium]